jgi:HEAT repeat protein
LEPEKSRGLDLLKQSLDDERKVWEVETAFQRLGRAAGREDIIEALIKRLDQEAGLGLVSALIAIGAQETHQEKIIDALAELLDDNHRFYERWYEPFELIFELGKVAAQPKILDRLCLYAQGNDPGRRGAAAETLGSFGTQAAMPRVLKALEGALEKEKGGDSSDPYRAEQRSRDQVYSALCRLATYSEG